MQVTLIAAVANNRTIGKNNDLPWKLKEDMRFFVRTTKGHAVISGRKNFESMGRPLPHRKNIVVSKNPALRYDGAATVGSIEQALALAAADGEEETFVIGGAQIYEAAFPYATRYYRTRVLADVPGDVRFPDLDLSDFRVHELARHGADAENDYATVIERLDRNGPARPLPQTLIPADFR